MNEKIFARQLDNGLWQWRLADEQGNWLNEDCFTGDNEALAESLGDRASPVVHLILPGTNVVATSETVESSIKRHLAKLLPFEMEEQIIDPVDDIHFVFGPVEGDRVEMLYAHADCVAGAIASLEEVNCDIQRILPDYLHLVREPIGAILVLDEGVLYCRTSDNDGFAIDESAAPIVVSQLKHEYDFTGVIELVAETEELAEAMKSWLPAKWLDENGPEIRLREGNFWSSISPLHLCPTFNMRRGRFARQLPIMRWVKDWKVPGYVAAAAFVLAMAAVSLEYFQAKAQFDRVRSEIFAVYKQVAPNGRSSDPVRAMESMVKGQGGKSEPTNVMMLIDSTAKALKNTPEVNLTSMRYSGDQKELRVNLETKNFSDLETLRTAIAKMGLAAELLRVSAQGEIQQASMSVAEEKS